MRLRLAVYTCQLAYFKQNGIEPDWVEVSRILDLTINQSSVIELRKYAQGIQYGEK